MRHIITKSLLALCLLSFTAPTAGAWNLRDLLGKAKEETTSGQDVLGLIDGLFSNSDFDISKLQGSWTVTGSAVGMKSENTLAGIGGKAATLAIEKKLDPYFKKYGLTGSTITFDAEGNFTLKLKKMTLSGAVSKKDKDVFETQFNVFGTTRLSPMDTYFERGVTGSSLNVMWDASKALGLIQGIASVVNIKSVSALSSLLSQYDDLYIGFKLTKQN